MYKLCVMGNDNSYELEFVLFDKKEEQLIGKAVEKLSNTYSRGDIPPEITALMGQKYTFIVKISSKKSFASKDPSFEVLYITHQFGKQTSIPCFQKQEQSSSTTISVPTPRHIPQLVPIKYKIETKQDELPLLQKSHSDTDPMEIEATEEQDSQTNKRDQPSNDDNNNDEDYKPIKGYFPNAKKTKQ